MGTPLRIQPRHHHATCLRGLALPCPVLLAPWRTPWTSPQRSAQPSPPTDVGVSTCPTLSCSLGTPEDSMGTSLQRSAQPLPPHCPQGLVLPCAVLLEPRGLRGDTNSEVSPGTTTVPHRPRGPHPPPILSCPVRDQRTPWRHHLRGQPSHRHPTLPSGASSSSCPVMSCQRPEDSVGKPTQRSAQTQPSHSALWGLVLILSCPVLLECQRTPWGHHLRGQPSPCHPTLTSGASFSCLPLLSYHVLWSPRGLRGDTTSEVSPATTTPLSLGSHPTLSSPVLSSPVLSEPQRSPRRHHLRGQSSRHHPTLPSVASTCSVLSWPVTAQRSP